jgi:RNA polymerase sigma-70 factor (ECF subfamily)
MARKRVMAATPTHIDGDERQLVENLYEGLRRFAATVAPWEMEPDDLLQEALVRALHKCPLRELDNPEGYLRRTMVNLAIDDQRRQSSRWKALHRLASPDDDQKTDVYPSDLDVLRRLSPQSRAVLYLAEVEGYPYKEIGRMLGCSETAARMGAMRARRRLRVLLAAEG